MSHCTPPRQANILRSSEGLLRRQIMIKTVPRVDFEDFHSSLPLLFFKPPPPEQFKAQMKSWQKKAQDFYLGVHLLLGIFMVSLFQSPPLDRCQLYTNL